MSAMLRLKEETEKHKIMHELGVSESNERHHSEERISRDQEQKPDEDQAQPTGSSIKLQDTSCQTDKYDQQQNAVNDFKKEEAYRLQCEILDHMLSKKVHLKDESHDHPQLKSLEHNLHAGKHESLQTELQQQQQQQQVLEQQQEQQ
jgi:hypothetical protein